MDEVVGDSQTRNGLASNGAFYRVDQQGCARLVSRESNLIRL